MTREEMEQQRTEAFDRWNWETGSEEDREKFEKLDKELKQLDHDEQMAEWMHIAKGIVYRHMREDIVDKETDPTAKQVMENIIDDLEEREKRNWKSKQ